MAWTAPKRDPAAPSRMAVDDNLHHAGRDLRERSFQAGVRESSLYSSAQMRPKTTLAIALVAGLAAGAAMFGLRKGDKGERD